MPWQLLFKVNHFTGKEIKQGNQIIYLDDSVSKKPLALCHKNLVFLNKDRSLRLVEWMEMLKLLDFSKVIFYLESVHPNMTKVKRYFYHLTLEWRQFLIGFGLLCVRRFCWSCPHQYPRQDGSRWRLWHPSSQNCLWTNWCKIHWTRSKDWLPLQASLAERTKHNSFNLMETLLAIDMAANIILWPTLTLMKWYSLNNHMQINLCPSF